MGLLTLPPPKKAEPTTLNGSQSRQRRQQDDPKQVVELQEGLDLQIFDLRYASLDIHHFPDYSN